MENNIVINQGKMNKNYYTKFFLMLSASFVAMYITIYLNTYEFNHIYFSLTLFYMTCIGISTMAVIMLLSMQNMSEDKEEYRYSYRKFSAFHGCLISYTYSKNNYRRLDMDEGDDSPPFDCYFNQ